jgi:hypothetical protein
MAPIDAAVLFVGAARVPPKMRGRPLTPTTQRAGAGIVVYLLDAATLRIVVHDVPSAKGHAP